MPQLSNRKKLKADECQNIYNRLMKYEERKKKAVAML
jgi:hypothetical protein